MPESVYSIGEDAFAECPNLVLTVTEDSYAHQYCVSNQLSFVTVSSTGRFKYADAGSDAVTITGYIGSAPYVTIPAQLDGKTVIGVADYAFRSRDYLVSVVLPDGLKTIGNEAFYCCRNLTYVTLPDTLEEIGSWAFFGCGSLARINLPESLKVIQGGAFGSCGSLRRITIPLRVKEIGIYAFSDCGKLDTAVIQNGVASIGNGMFLNCTALNTVEIPNSVTFIGNAAFKGCQNLWRLVLPAGDIVFGENESPFAECPNLTLVVTSGSGAEQYCIDNQLDHIVAGSTTTP